MKEPAALYTPLSQSRSEIRLLRIDQEGGNLCAALHNVSLHAAPKYIAVSYTWGVPEDKRDCIHVNGQEINVQSNLFEMLPRLRQMGDEYFWIDAVCINQVDRTERSSQVGLMKHVYQNAAMVVAWLGSSSASSDRVMCWVRDMYDHKDNNSWLNDQFCMARARELLTDLAHLLQRSYWTRIWIIQEVVCGRNVMVVCGNEVVQAAAIAFVQREYAERRVDGMYICNIHFQGQEDINVTLGYRGLRSIWAIKPLFGRGELRLFDALQYHVTKACTDPRNKIYGLVGLGEAVLPVNYDWSVTEVFAKHFQYEVEASKRLDILTFASAASRARKGHLEAPSWVPDWTFFRTGHARFVNILEPHFQYTASGQTEAGVIFGESTITVEGILIGTISALGKTTDMENRADIQRGVATFCSWSREVFNSSQLCGWTKVECIARSLLANRYRAEEYADFEHTEPDKDVAEPDFLKGFLGAWSDKLVSSNETLHPLLVDCIKYKSRRFRQSKENDRLWSLWIKDSLRYLYDRRLFVMTGKEFGLVPDEAQIGDCLCALLGCPVPMLLRPVGDRFVVIGEAYIDGWMFGKAVVSTVGNPDGVRRFVLM